MAREVGVGLRQGLMMGGTVVLALQWTVLRLAGVDLSPQAVAIASGLSILGAAFLLSWSAEVAQLDIPQALALAFLAFIAVLPEYSVDLYFAWQAGQDPAYTKFATANMTGANRLLIGVGWAGVVYAWWAKSGRCYVRLEKAIGVELTFLVLATNYSFTIPLKGTLSLIDSSILLFLFVAYVAAAARGEHVSPNLEGPSELIARLVPWARRGITVGLFLMAGGAILMAAEPFAESLLATGRGWGVEEFILVQWLAPLASETPEFVIAIIFALRGNPGAGLGTLISSKVNQWTLLVGALPVAYCLSGGHLQAMPLDERQAEEIFLTAAQSLLAVAVIADSSFSLVEAVVITLLFLSQAVTISSSFRFAFAFLYLALAAALLVMKPAARKGLVDLLTMRSIRR